ncbi:unnamed protein product, partial [Pleuronectes platessa]
LLQDSSLWSIQKPDKALGLSNNSTNANEDLELTLQKPLLLSNPSSPSTQPYKSTTAMTLMTRLPDTNCEPFTCEEVMQEIVRVRRKLNLWLMLFFVFYVYSSSSSS